MKKKLNIFFIILLAGFSVKTVAQTENPDNQIQSGDRVYTFNIGVGLPVGDLHTFIQNKIFAGLNFEYRSFKTDRVDVGFSIGWNSFKQKYDRSVFQTSPNSAISSVENHFLYTVPVLLSAHYHFPTTIKWLKPYAGAGLGAHIVEYEKWYGIYDDKKTLIRFGARPQVGVFIPISTKMGINLAGRYNYVVYKYGDINNLSYLELNVGLYIVQY